jgi:hypothetical protein
LEEQVAQEWMDALDDLVAESGVAAATALM